MKTIKRTAGMPWWAEWLATNDKGLTTLFSRQPEAHSGFWATPHEVIRTDIFWPDAQPGELYKIDNSGPAFHNPTLMSIKQDLDDVKDTESSDPEDIAVAEFARGIIERHFK